MTKQSTKKLTVKFEISTDGPRPEQTVTLSFNSQNEPPWIVSLETPRSKPSIYQARTLIDLKRQTGDAPDVQQRVESLARKLETREFSKLIQKLNLQ